jgi:hypothetical protein
MLPHCRAQAELASSIFEPDHASVLASQTKSEKKRTSSSIFPSNASYTRSTSSLIPPIAFSSLAAFSPALPLPSASALTGPMLIPQTSNESTETVIWIPLQTKWWSTGLGGRGNPEGGQGSSEAASVWAQRSEG